jgi:dihydrolipoamide dehydrogenase
LGFKTACIDKRKQLGGTCLNVGCIPSKSLLEATDLLKRLKEKGNEFGIGVPSVTVDFSQMMGRKEKIVQTLTEGVNGLFIKNHVTRIFGEASFVDSHQLIVKDDKESRTITADHIIIATGSDSIQLSHLPFDEKRIVSSTGALSLTEIPKKMIVVGGVVIGVELASVYNRLGTQVIVVEMLDQICPMLDETLSKQLLQSLKKQGIEFRLSSKVTQGNLKGKIVKIVVEHEGKEENLEADILLVAVGRRPYCDGLNLEGVGITKNSKGYISVDERFRTTQPHIYGIGDVIEGTMLAHRASAEGVAVVESIYGINSMINYLSIPNVIYTDPEVATVGLTEQEARQAGREVIIGKSLFKANSRARCSSEMEGLVKVVGDKKSGILLGLHIIGPHASELIGEGMLAIQKKATVEDLAKAVQAHPTLSEAIKEAALDALGCAIHH